MKKLRNYLILLGLLGGISLFLWLGRSKGTYSRSDHDFALADTAAVREILIETALSKAFITRKGASWKINGQPARNEAVRGLFVLISRLEAEAPVSRAGHDRIMGLMDSLSTRISIEMMDGNEKSYRAVYDPGTDATYMVMENSELPFRTSVRGFREKNLLRFYVADPAFWRSNILFSIPAEQIGSVHHVDNRDPQNSFQLQRDGSGKMLIARGPGAGPRDIPAEEKLRQYLSYYGEVRFESFCDPERDTLSYREEPSDILDVETTEGERIIVEFYPIWHTGPGGERIPENNYLYAWTEREQECLVVKYVQIDLLLKDYEYFAGF